MLQQFLNDELAEADAIPVNEHIDGCGTCQESLARLVGTLPNPLEQLAQHGDTALTTESACVAPDTRARQARPDQAPEAIQVPGYEILGEVGRGGMGVVYRARALRLDRIVALKMLLAGGHASAKDRARFLQESEAVAQLQHPHIVALYEAGQHGDLLYFTLEFIAEGSLADQLGGTPLPPLTAARLVENVARGMHHAHERGIVHRDLKPGNILLQKDESGRISDDLKLIPKITDFGLAKNLEVDSALTSAGAVFGTPSYMAPEQALGSSKEVGAGADVYALGAILYECLTGRPPFRGPTPTETLLQVLHQEPAPPSTLQPGVPRDLETICLNCLRKGVKERFASALDLAEDLRRFQDGEPIHARPVGRFERLLKWCRRRPAVASLSAAIVLVLLLGGILAAWQWRQTATALTALQKEKTVRVRRQALALPDAAAARVPTILEELEANRNEVLPLLHEQYQKEKENSRRMRLALALVPVEPETFREPLTDWMLSAQDPAEVLLTREALAPHGADLVARLWAKAEGADMPVDVRFRSLVALAAFDPGNDRWRALGPRVAEHLLGADRLHRSQWIDALRQVRPTMLASSEQALFAPLRKATKNHYLSESSEGPTIRLVLRISDIEKIDGQEVLARLEQINEGIVWSTEDVSVTAQGLFRHRIGALEISPPLCLLPFPVTPGQTWEGDIRISKRKGKASSRIVGTEEVEVPAGRFQAVVVELIIQMEGESMARLTSWYAPGIGLVKQTNVSIIIPFMGPVAARTAGLMVAPLGFGPLLAASRLFTGFETKTTLLEKIETER